MANAEQRNKNKNFKCIKMVDGFKKVKVKHNVTQCVICADEKGVCHNGCNIK